MIVKRKKIWVTYSAVDHTLWIDFPGSGESFCYFDVPRFIFEELAEDERPLAYYRDHIKGHYAEQET